MTIRRIPAETLDVDETEIYNFAIGKVGGTKGTYALKISIQ